MCGRKSDPSPARKCRDPCRGADAPSQGAPWRAARGRTFWSFERLPKVLIWQYAGCGRRSSDGDLRSASWGCMLRAMGPQLASSNGRVVVIGAGIVGTCCALFLQREGFRVTLMDHDEPGSGCSAGNAGLIHSGSVLPLATPGILRRVPGMLTDPEGPLLIRWRYLPVAAALAAAARAQRRARTRRGDLRARSFPCCGAPWRRTGRSSPACGFITCSRIAVSSTSFAARLQVPRSPRSSRSTGRTASPPPSSTRPRCASGSRRSRASIRADIICPVAPIRSIRAA